MRTYFATLEKIAERLETPMLIRLRKSGTKSAPSKRGTDEVSTPVAVAVVPALLNVSHSDADGSTDERRRTGRGRYRKR